MKKFYVPRRKRWQGRNNNFRAWEYLHSSNKSYLHFWLQALQVPDLICWPWNFAFWLSLLERLHWLSKSVPGYDCPDLLKMFLLTRYFCPDWLCHVCPQCLVNIGAAESGVRTVYLHTHFLAPSFIKDYVLWSHLLLRTPTFYLLPPPLQYIVQACQCWFDWPMIFELA